MNDASSAANLAGASWLKGEELQAVLGALDAQGGATRIVGGAVRNGLFGEPVGDIDLATIFLPAEVIKRAEAAGLKTAPTGIAHGTVTVIADGTPFEVTTLRSDVETDGRRAVVAFTADWLEDARRRDFTINALYCDGQGQVFDPLGGLRDVTARRVRFIGKPQERITEDYLRILRFFRFFAWYGHGRPDPLLRLAAMLPPDLAKVKALAKRLKLARAEANRLNAWAKAPDADAALDETALGEMLYRHGAQPVRDRLVHGFARAAQAGNQVDAAALRKQIFIAENWRKPVFPLKGKDLLAAGMKAGPAVGKRLKALEEAWVEDGFAGDKEALLDRLAEKD